MGGTRSPLAAPLTPPPQRQLLSFSPPLHTHTLIKPPSCHFRPHISLPSSPHTFYRSFLATGVLSGHPDRLWVNPDCGLKTRAWPETLAALRNMVQAATECRIELQQRQGGEPESTAGGQAAAPAAAPSPHRCCC